MFRTSSYLAIALTVTAIGSAAPPAAAFSSQVFGGANPTISAQLHPGPVSTSVQQSRQASHVDLPKGPPPKIQLATGSATMSPTAKIPIPKETAAAGTIMKQPQIPVGSLPKGLPGASTTVKLPEISVTELPKGLPGAGSTVKNAQENYANNPNLCGPPLPPCKWPCEPKPPYPPTPSGGKDDDDKGHGPIVILAPQVPVAVPVYVPSRVATGPVVVSQARPFNFS